MILSCTTPAGRKVGIDIDSIILVEELIAGTEDAPRARIYLVNNLYRDVREAVSCIMREANKEEL